MLFRSPRLEPINTGQFNTTKTDETVVNLLFSKIDITFDFLDKELEKLDIPKDVSNIIFEYAKPYCAKCDKCCCLCKYMCTFECLREERDVCCQWENDTIQRKYY